MQTLEDRRLLTVNVTATKTKATITSDGNGDSVLLLFTGITGLDGTTVNIDDSFREHQSSVKEYEFRMQGGDDRVEIVQSFGATNITVKGGAGRNTLIIRDSQVKELEIQNGTGYDVNIIERTQIGQDGPKNTGFLDIQNGRGGTSTTVKSLLTNPGTPGPSGGRSVHAKLVRVVNGPGNQANIVSFENVRLRQSNVVVNSAGVAVTGFTDVDRVKNIVVQHEEDVQTGSGSIVALENTHVEFGGVLVETTGAASELSSLHINDGFIKTKVIHQVANLGGGARQSKTTIKDEAVIGGPFTVFNEGLGSSEVKIEQAGFVKNVKIDNFDVGAQKIEVKDSLFQGKTLVRNDTGSTDLDILDSGFEKNLTIQSVGGSVTKVHSSEFLGNFLFKAKEGVDEIAIDDSLFHKKTTIQTDTSKVADSAELADKIEIQRTGDGNTEFKGNVSISTGGGADTVDIGGRTVLPNDLVNFRRAVKLNGGAGIDNLFVGVWTTFDVTPKVLGFEGP